jgi:hypothetical protein
MRNAGNLSMGDFFIIAISIILFAGPDLRFRGPCADQVTGAFNYIKIAMFYFGGPLNTRTLCCSTVSTVLNPGLVNLFVTFVTLLL